MTEKYENQNDFELVFAIKEMVDELDRRWRVRLERMNASNAKILKEAGYDDNDINTQDKVNELIKKVMNPGSDDTILVLKKKRAIKPKYRHPQTNEEWAGRGAFVPPWVAKVMNERGWTVQQFKESDEFIIKGNKKQK